MTGDPETSAGGAPIVGISACLLGEPVRYDGGHRRAELLRERFDPHVRWLPLCPEVEAGLGVPRPPIQLEGLAGEARDGSTDRPRVIGVETRMDHTHALAHSAAACVVRLREAGASGCVLKSRSPSCGLGDATLFDDAGRARGTRDGVFAAVLREGLPTLPLASEEALADAAGRASFLSAVHAHRAFDEVRAGEVSLRTFHRRHVLLALAHNPHVLPRLRFLRDAGVPGAYAVAFFGALRLVPGPQGHHEALHHALEIVGRHAPAIRYEELAAPTEAHVRGEVSLREAMDGLSRAVRRYAVFELLDDPYLHPGEACLREYETL